MSSDKRGPAPAGTEWGPQNDNAALLAKQLQALKADHRAVSNPDRESAAAVTPPTPPPTGPPPARATERDALKQRALDGVLRDQQRRGG
jgi:hypothetical protein